MKYLSLFEQFEDDPILCAINDIRGLGYPNPFNGREIVIDDVATVEVSKFDKALWISSILTFKKGYATDIMKKICDIADKHSVSIKLSPEPFGKKDLNKKELVSWYKRLGFKASSQGNLIRTPNVVIGDVSEDTSDVITESVMFDTNELLIPINERVVILSCDETIPVYKLELVVGKLGVIQEKQALLGMITLEFPEDLTKEQIDERMHKLKKITGVKEIFNDIYCKLY